MSFSLDPGLLALWIAVGIVGGSIAYRAADALLERGAGLPGLSTRCPRCGAPLGPLVTIATLAALFRARCAGCGWWPERAQFAAELLMGALFAIVSLRGGDATARLTDALALLVLLAATLTDLRERLVPDLLTYPAILLWAALSFLPGGVAPESALVGALAGGGTMLAIYALGRALYRRDVFGFGDVKLALFVGIAVGWPRVLGALIGAAFSGGLIAVLLLFAGRGRAGTMPYGPAIALGAAIQLVGP
ncbi:MAG: prepilin peptidase [Chloroflexi bacterium]|nr:prepilin peptidase [Chloroflexota bacterium]